LAPFDPRKCLPVGFTETISGSLAVPLFPIEGAALKCETRFLPD
jgi:hypothetical protein